ncbi:serine/threonine-protein kinase [Verrucomicrobiaceae bacterium 227]
MLREEESVLESESGVPQIEGIELQAEIGEGGFGIVYRAQQVGVVRRKVALKVLKPGVDTRQVLRRFEVERQALAHLEHPGIARFYEAGQTKEGYPYFTMELVEGVPVHEAVAGQSLTEMLHLFLRICEGIAHAHEQGVLHRDLKPSNILVTPAGVPKVIDFGLAKALDADQAPGMTLYTGGESWLGTPGYAAPEQLKASEIELDERVDVYSLGAILYHLLTGMNPEDSRELAVAANVLPPPSEVALQKIDAGLDAIVGRALAPDREKRYRSVREFMADLRRYLNGDDLSVKVEKSKSQRGLIAAAIIGSLAAGWGSYNMWKGSQVVAVPADSGEVDYDNFIFEEMGFQWLEDDEAAIPPFNDTRVFSWFRFQKPDGGEFILSYDGKFGSSTVTQIFVGGKRPDDPGVRVIAIDSAEDQKLVALLLSLIEKVVGSKEAGKLDEISWQDLPKGEGSERLRMHKNLIGAVWAFEARRKDRKMRQD